MTAIFNEGSLFDGSDPHYPVAQPSPPPSGYLGRFQLGQVVPLSVIARDSGSFPAAPDTEPIFTIKDVNNKVIATGPMALTSDPTLFEISFFLGFGISLGTYTVGYTFVVSGVTGSATGSFDVIPGGDPGGRIISMYAYQCSGAQYVVTHLASGLVLQGRNPTI